MENTKNAPDGGAVLGQAGQSAGQASATQQTVSAEPEGSQSKSGTQQTTTKQTVGDQLPQGTSQRTTEQFDKLKDSNKRLYDANQLLQQELRKKEQATKQFAPVQQTPGQTQTKEPKVEDFIQTDPQTGEQYVNEDKLKKAIDDAGQRATRAETAVQSYINQQQQIEEKRQTEEAYASYPQLDPKSEKYDASLSRVTRANLLDSMMNPNDYKGRALTFKEAADLASGKASQKTMEQQTKEKETAEKEAKEAKEKEKQEKLEAKQQATAGAKGVPSTTQEPAQDEEARIANLRMRSRQGDMWAVAQRLTKVDHTGTPSSSKKET